MRRWLGVIVVALVIMMGLNAIAQENETVICPSGQVDQVADVLDDFAARLRAGEEDPLPIILELRDRSARFAAACTGLRFSSEAVNSSPVIGPITIAEGVYRARAITDGPMTVDMEILSGQCAAQRPGSLFDVVAGQGTNGVEALFESAGCEAVISVGNTTAAWVLEFELMNVSTITESNESPIQTLYATGSANLRSCAGTQCGIVGTLSAGDEIAVLEQVDGQAVNAGNAIWYRLDYNGTEAYVYSAVVSDQKPTVTTGGGNVTSPSTAVAPASPVPVVVTSPFGCNGIDDLNCDDFRAIGQNANAHLAACGDEDRLDRDGDGRACE